MGEITGSHNGDTLYLSRVKEIFQIQVPGRGPGKFGMNVKVCKKSHHLPPEYAV
jgi:hypothetical protein